MAKETPSADDSPATTGRNPLVLILGFAFLGLAAAVLLFGSSLLGGQGSADPADDSVLDQVSELEVSDPVINQIPNNDLAGLEVGATAPDFILNDLDGNPQRLSDFQGRPVIINFWATWCAPCRIEMPELQAAYEEHQDDGLVLLAINRDEAEVVVRDYFVSELGLTFTPLLDPGAVVNDLYEVFNMPTTYFVNGDGVITVVHRGPMTESQIDDYLNETLGG